MKIILTLASPPNPDSPTSLSIQGSDDNGKELLTASIPDISRATAILPRLQALANLLPKKPQ